MSHRRSIILALSLLAGVTAGCRSDDVSNADPQLPANAAEVAADTLRDASGRFVQFYSAFQTRERIVVRHAESWAAMWSNLSFGVGPQPPLPPVDFATREVIIAAMGTRPTGGYSIGIDRVADTPTERWVVVRETTPGNCATTQALTSPAIAIVVPKSTKSVVFVERQATFNCE